jgi:hypothetical protein
MRELRDQLAHGGYLALMVLPFGIAPNILTGMWAGFLAALLREITEEGEVSLPALKRALGSRNDLIGWTAFGAVIGLIAGLFA